MTLTTTPWDPNAPQPTRTPVPPPPDLLYSDPSGLWRITSEWQPALVIDQPGAVLSPDGSQAFYQEFGDIWLVDIASGQRRSLTAESDRLHCCAWWWPARPEKLVLGSWPAESEMGPSNGHLTLIDIEDGSYTVLDSEIPSNADPAPGPDGRTIAYDRAGEAWLYDLVDGPQQLDPTQYGVTGIVRIGGPAWSPNGQQLAWTAAAVDPERRIVLIVFDLAERSARLFHPYQNAGRGGWFPPPAWSPDDRYLAFVAEDIDAEKAGIWVVAADGSQEIHLGPGTNPSWSPDGRWLLYTAYEGEGENQVRVAWLVETDSWYPLRMQLPPDAAQIGWPP